MDDIDGFYYNLLIFTALCHNLGDNAIEIITLATCNIPQNLQTGKNIIICKKVKKAIDIN